MAYSYSKTNQPPDVSINAGAAGKVNFAGLNPTVQSFYRALSVSTGEGVRQAGCDGGLAGSFFDKYLANLVLLVAGLAAIVIGMPVRLPCLALPCCALGGATDPKGVRVRYEYIYGVLVCWAQESMSSLFDFFL